MKPDASPVANFNIGRDIPSYRYHSAHSTAICLQVGSQWGVATAYDQRR